MFDRSQNKRRPGRPKKSNYDKLTLHRIQLTLGEQDYWSLNYICKKLGISKSDALREGLRIYFDKARFMDYPDDED